MVILWWFLNNMTIYIKFNNLTDSIMAIAEDSLPSFSVMFAANMCLQKLNAFKFYHIMYVLWC